MLKTKYLLLLIIILCLAFTIPVYSAELFADDFEDGTMDAWTATVTDDGKLSITEAAALHGTYGMSVLMDDTTEKYARDDTPDAETRYRLRFYIDPNGLTMANNDNLVVIRTFIPDDSGCYYIKLVYDTATKYNIQITYKDDSGYQNCTEFVITDAPHCIELDAKISSGADDGFIELFIDGVSKEKIEDIDNDTKTICRTRLGVSSTIPAGTSGTLYLDDFVTNDNGTEIGTFPEPSGTHIFFTFASF